MKKRRLFTLLPLLILILVGVMACQPEVVEVTKIVTEAQQVVVTQVVEVEEEVVVMEVAATAMPIGTPTVGPVNGSPGGAAGNEVASSDSGNVQAQTRLIIKDGNMNLVVRDTDAAAAQVVDLTLDMGGYLISQQIWSDERERRYASLQLGVPSDQFERAMGAFRTLGTVTQESANGQDVTDEYFDLNSHLGNLYATQEQLRTFLSQATNTEETLAVYAELSRIESEINAIQGRIQFLSDRAAYSTISLTLNPFIPTPTPIPPEPDEWQPGRTAARAVVNLQNTAQNTADWAIYSSIACGPWLVAAAVLTFLVWRVVGWVRRRPHKQAVTATTKERNQ